MDKKIEKFITDNLGEKWFEMGESAKTELFGSNIVDKVFIEAQEFIEEEEFQFSWKNYTLPRASGMVILFVNGKLLHIDNHLNGDLFMQVAD